MSHIGRWARMLGRNATLTIRVELDKDEGREYLTAVIHTEPDDGPSRAVVGVSAEIEDDDVFDRLTDGMVRGHCQR